jgi:hypothetical protein
MQKIISFIPTPSINISTWVELITHHFISFLSSKLAFYTHLHAMSSSSTNSSEGVEGAMWNALQAAKEEAMLKLDEASSSRPKHRRSYINHDCESAHDRIRVSREVL